MKFKNIAILSSKESWFIPYARDLVEILKGKGYQSKLFYNYENILDNFQVVFVLSYFLIIDKKSLIKHKYNLVVHESSLPKGRGWSPLFWQILEGKNKIPIVLFRATDKIDGGPIYIKDYIKLNGNELHEDIRKAQAEKTVEICLCFLENIRTIKTVKQKGEATYYRRRIPSDSELSISKTVKEQFNILRISNNKDYPAFFNYKGYKYVIKIFKEKDERKNL